MALPKRRISKTKKNMRRSHLALTPKQTSKCKRCRQPKLPHRVCTNCGHYKNRQILEPEKA